MPGEGMEELSKKEKNKEQTDGHGQHCGDCCGAGRVGHLKFCHKGESDTDLGPQDLLLRFQYSNTHTHGLQTSCGGKGMDRPVSQEESTSQHLGNSLKGGAPRALG